jgi:hypothetical protein
MQQEDPRPLLDIRSVVVAVVVLVVGAALGFGVGYKYEKHAHTSPKSTAEKGTTSTTTKSSGSSSHSAEEVKTIVIACMASEGVKYPSPTSDVSHPPAGVSEDAYKLAYAKCAKRLLAKP